jgi:tripartite ATP-independent transporter DctP family solute receptor
VLLRRSFVAASLGAAVSRAVAARAADQFTMRLNVTEAATSVFGVCALHYAAAVGRRTNGQIKIEVYPNGQIARDADAIDMLSNGVVELAIQPAARFVQRSPRWAVWDMPFLVRNLAAGFRVLDGPIGNDFFNELEGMGVVGLTWGTGGFKELETTTKAVTVPDDMKGLRIRAPGAVYVATYKALGAIPVTIDFAEVYVALQQRSVDGLDVNLDSIATGKFYNVIKHVAMTNHVFSINMLGNELIERISRAGNSG